MLIHYTIVRRDLPLGVVCAQLVHAAGESAALYKSPTGRPFGGSIAVVLEVKNEAALGKAVQLLFEHNIPHIRVRESAPPYLGAFMAIGVVPMERELIAPLLIEFQTLKVLDNPETPA